MRATPSIVFGKVTSNSMPLVLRGAVGLIIQSYAVNQAITVMNTVKKGGQFEEHAYRAVTQALESKELGLLPQSCKIYRQRGYYSKDRKRDIIVDISIEVTLPGADRWSFLWVFECKDYTSRVPVDDVEEFWAKLQQIAGANVKGAIVSSSPLQEGAIEFAKSKGIMVAHYLPHFERMTISVHNTAAPDAPDFVILEDDVCEDSTVSEVEFDSVVVDFPMYGQFQGIHEGHSHPTWSELLLASVVVDATNCITRR